MFRSALVGLKPGSSNDVATNWAVSVATQRGWSLVGVSVLDPNLAAPRESVPLGASSFKAERDQETFAKSRIAAQTAIDAFRDRCQSAGVACNSVACEGHLAEETSRIAQRVDVLVIGRGARQELPVPTESSALQKVVSHCPRPTIVVPAIPPPCNRALLAYDGSRQSVRAVQSFLHSGLPTGRELHLVAVGDLVAGETIMAAVEYLRLHDMVVEVHHPTCRQSVADDILELADHLQVDLLVLGAYGKPKLTEFLFGSVTQHILRQAKIPIFLDH